MPPFHCFTAHNVNDRIGRLVHASASFSHVTCSRYPLAAAVNFCTLVGTTLCYKHNNIVTGLHIPESGSVLFEHLQLVFFNAP